MNIRSNYLYLTASAVLVAALAVSGFDTANSEEGAAHHPPRASAGLHRSNMPLERDPALSQAQLAGSAQRNRVALVYPIPALEQVPLVITPEREVPLLLSVPNFSGEYAGKRAAKGKNGELVFFTLQPALQERVERLVKSLNVPHLAIVAMNPNNGAILALAERSKSLSHPLLHADFPAASLFKLVTSAAALEQGGIDPLDQVRFRGGNYTLNQWNYKPNPKTDRRAMSVAEALGRSCNGVFARLALQNLNPQIIRSYSEAFGFNQDLGFSLPLPRSHASVPADDFGLSRTAAGFGEVFISPIHAAAAISAVANGGLLPRPLLIERVTDNQGYVKYRARSAALRRVVQRETARKLMGMMEYTTTIGTSRRDFSDQSWRKRGTIRVAAKTGTLSGKAPTGTNHWFVAAAPIEKPEIAVAVIINSPGLPSKRASWVGRKIIESYLDVTRGRKG